MADQVVDQVIDTANIFTALINKKLPARQAGQRDSWEFDSSYSQEKFIPAIKMSVNPNSASFSQTKRTSTGKKTIGGTTFFHWADKTGRNLDPLVITFQGETGAISGLGATSQQQDNTSLIRVNGVTKGTRAELNGRNWARLYTLTAQPQINPETFKPTLWTIRYRSLLFPDVLFSGFFNNVLQFTDDAANPFSKKYSMVFTVTEETSPNILELINLIGNFDPQMLSVGSAVKGRPSLIP